MLRVRLSLAAILLIGMFQPVGAQTEGVHPLALDVTATQLQFHTAAATGSLKYRIAYPQGWERSVILQVHFANPGPLSCFTYGDFHYEMRNSEGALIPVNPLALRVEEVFSLASAPNCRLGSAVERSDGRAIFYLDFVFGPLKPGDYALTLAFNPKNHADLSFGVLTISFHIDE